MKNYSKSVSGSTSQSKPLLGSNQKMNNAGGFSFEVSPQDRLERFILIGSEGGTYHVAEQKLTEENAASIVALIQTDGLQVVATVSDFAVDNRAPKADAGIFVLALCATYGNEATKCASYQAISKVCKTSTHLFTFLANIQNLRGWSRGLRNGVARFYTDRSSDQVAYQMVKYRERAGFTHRDALRLAHPKTLDSGKNALFAWATENSVETSDIHPLVTAFAEAQSSETAKEVLKVLKESDVDLTWEMIPTKFLNSPEVLLALLDRMPTIALIRNLNRFSYNGLTDTNNATTKRIVAKLTDEIAVKKSGIHPINVVNAMLTYSSGHGTKGDKSWEVNQKIVDALDETFNFALQALIPTGKDILVAVDISGSMNHPVGGMAMSASQIGNILALTILKSEKNAELIWFDTEVSNPTIGRRSSVQEVLEKSPHGGGTDCAAPVANALEKKAKYDAIVILTDSETWAGNEHQIETIKKYRSQVNPEVKIVEVALVANRSSNIPDNDKNLLRVVGFDASVTDVINSFLEG